MGRVRGRVEGLGKSLEQAKEELVSLLNAKVCYLLGCLVSRASFGKSLEDSCASSTPTPAACLVCEASRISPMGDRKS